MNRKSFRNPGRVDTLALTLALAAALAAAAPARADNLLQIYREAQQNDPALASARAIWQATQEKLPQARAACCPTSARRWRATTTTTGSASRATRRATTSTATTRSATARSPPRSRSTASATWSRTTRRASRSRRPTTRWRFAQQDLILRVTVAYFDILLAQYNIELVQAQKNAVSEQLAQAKRNFEVGVATITDTNEAQARYDQIIANEISTQNDYDNRVTALRAIINRIPGRSPSCRRTSSRRSQSPTTRSRGSTARCRTTLNVQVAQSTVTLQSLEIDRQRAGHLPTVDLVASYGGSWGNGSTSFSENFNTRSGLIGPR